MTSLPLVPLALVACRETAPVGLVGEPILHAYPDTPLARQLIVEVDTPARLTVELRSGDRDFVVGFPDLSTTFDVPLLGFTPDATYDVVLRGTTPDGRTTELDTLQVTTEPLPDDFPVAEVVANDPERSEGGYWLVPIEYPDGPFWLAIYDVTDLSVVWLYRGPVNWGDVRFEPGSDHRLFGLFKAAVEMDLYGNILMSWATVTIDGIPGVEIPWQLNHEGYPLDDGSFWSIAAQSTHVDAYPTTYADPTAQFPATIEDPLVVHVAPDGTVVDSWALASILDPTRIGFDGLDIVAHGLDWAHANAVIPDPAGGYVVSVRHQDCLVGLDDDGGLKWILGDPAGWRSPWSDRLLAPVGDVSWPYHQHGPTFAPDGTLWVFDNHSVDGTPYEVDEPTAGPSRAIGYAVDPAAGTVAQVGEWYPPAELQSNALGSVDVLPRTGHLLIDFGMTRGEDGAANADAGWGNNTGRVFEADPSDPDPVVDVRFRTDADVWADGINLYRVEPVPSLYGGAATELRVR